MARLLLLDGQVEEINAVVITAYTIMDELGRVAGGANSKKEAEKKVAKLSVSYPHHHFSIS